MVCVLFLGVSLPLGAQQPMTWQQANARSAEIIRASGANAEAAKLAQAAFDLYPLQTNNYKPAMHGQLLLNLMDVREKVQGRGAALEDADRGEAAIELASGRRDPVLIDVWRDAIRMCRSAGDWNRVHAYYGRIVELAEALWGAADARVIKARLDWVTDVRNRGAAWAQDMLRTTHSRAAAAGADEAALTPIELTAAKVELEQRNWKKAIEGYERLTARLAQRNDPRFLHVLQVAYAQLTYAYDQDGDDAAAQRTQDRLVGTFGAAPTPLVPLLRIPPLYPRRALRDGREGSVRVLLSIDETGAVVDVSVVKSRPAGVFEAAAIEAVRQWRFKPTLVDGQPVSHKGLWELVFKI